MIPSGSYDFGAQLNPDELLSNNEEKKRRKKRKSKRKKKKDKSKRKKSKKKRKKKSNKNKIPKGGIIPSGPSKRMELKSNSKGGLPIITEEDNESNFSASYLPTRYDASGYFSYHTWGGSNIRAPREDKVVRIGPSLWHWDWDLSFGLYDDLYDSMTKKFQNMDIIHDTWLKYEGPVQPWQPLLASILWFITAMNILYPVSLIGEAVPTSWDVSDSGSNTQLSHFNIVSNTSDVGSFNSAINRTININTSYPHLQVGGIFFTYEVTLWVVTKPVRYLLLFYGPSGGLVSGLFLMTVSQFIIAEASHWYNYNFILGCCVSRSLSALGFCLFRESSMFFWSYFAKLDMLASGIGFCIGPVLGDLLYVYVGWSWSYYVYAILLGCCAFSMLSLTLGQYLTKKDINKLEIPAQIRNIRKPRSDLFHYHVRSPNKLLILLKSLILLFVIISLTMFEVILPSYCINPKLNVEVSGALFTLFYLPLLALCALIGLFYSKNNEKLFTSAEKHLLDKRKNLKYITKTLSINVHSTTQTISGNNKIKKKIGVTKSEKIKTVEKPSWLSKRKRQLPSPDISQHHIIILFGLLAMGIGYIILSNQLTGLTTGNLGGNLIVGLILISFGCGFTIISCSDSFINGLAFHTNQVLLLYRILLFGILLGPPLGGLLIDLYGFRTTFLLVGIVLLILLFIHSLYQFIVFSIKYLKNNNKNKLFDIIVNRCCNRLSNNDKNTQDKQKMNRNGQLLHSILGAGANEDSNNTLSEQSTNMNNSHNNKNASNLLYTPPQLQDTSPTGHILNSSNSNNSGNNDNNSNNGLILKLQPSAREINKYKASSSKIYHQDESKSTTLSDIPEFLNELNDSVNTSDNISNEPTPPLAVNTNDIDDDNNIIDNNIVDNNNIIDNNKHKIHEHGSLSKYNESQNEVETKINKIDKNDIIDNKNMNETFPTSVPSRGLVDRRDPSIKVQMEEKELEEMKSDTKSKSSKKKKHKTVSISTVFVHGSNLRHLCWWKRGLNVRFPYIQWLDSGWSKSRNVSSIQSFNSNLRDLDEPSHSIREEEHEDLL